MIPPFMIISHKSSQISIDFSVYSDYNIDIYLVQRRQRYGKENHYNQP